MEFLATKNKVKAEYDIYKRIIENDRNLLQAFDTKKDWSGDEYAIIRDDNDILFTMSPMEKNGYQCDPVISPKKREPINTRISLLQGLVRLTTKAQINVLKKDGEEKYISQSYVVAFFPEPPAYPRGDIYKKAYKDAFGEQGYVLNPETDLTSMDVLKNILDGMREYLPIEEQEEIDIVWAKINPNLEKMGREDLKGPTEEEIVLAESKRLIARNAELEKKGQRADDVLEDVEGIKAQAAEEAEMIKAKAIQQAEMIKAQAAKEAEMIKAKATEDIIREKEQGKVLGYEEGKTEGKIEGIAKGKAEIIEKAGSQMSQLKDENVELKNKVEKFREIMERAKKWIGKQMVKGPDGAKILSDVDALEKTFKDDASQELQETR